MSKKIETTEKNLDYYRKNAEEDYLITPISVLRYISEMEEALLAHNVFSLAAGGAIGALNCLFTTKV